jgi:hypothetical protein
MSKTNTNHKFYESLKDSNGNPVVIRCERCNERLNPKTAVWLELSMTDGKYYKQIPEGHLSQGGFSFGIACSKTQLKEDNTNDKA